MRKVFLSTVILTPIDPSNPTKHQSRDFDLEGKNFCFPISFLLDANIAEGDEALIITGMSQTDTPRKNYELLKKEMEEILAAHKATAQFVVVEEPDANSHRDIQDVLTFSGFMKEISDLMADGDEIYADMTYGVKSYTLAVFIALTYVVKACRDAELKRMIYAQFYSGKKVAPNTADIIDITSLFRISNIVNEAKPGQKAEIDQLLSFMVG